ncbi:unnamed protein product [Callosobruchus maculatus]|uniref:Transgelin n=1 Tax=Callosobruchus maculatus TaxID=64391 RepID=A0A653BKU6_CALMS|nr:unnamed protein product [Callosobruchus maculatus]
MSRIYFGLRNVSILDELGNPKRLSSIVSTRIPAFFGRIHRNDNMDKLVVQGHAPSGRRRGRSPTRCVDTTKHFLAAIKAYGVADVDLFQTVDLWEKKDIAQVTNTLFALGRETYRHPEWKGSHLGPKPAEENKRDFDEATLRAGETMIGLQAGTNKGATQAGQNIGAGRKIILGK